LVKLPIITPQTDNVSQFANGSIDQFKGGPGIEAAVTNTVRYEQFLGGISEP